MKVKGPDLVRKIPVWSSVSQAEGNLQAILVSILGNAKMKFESHKPFILHLRLRSKNVMCKQLLSRHRVLLMQNFIKLNHKVWHNEYSFWFNEYVYWASSMGLAMLVLSCSKWVPNIAKIWGKYTLFGLGWKERSYKTGKNSINSKLSYYNVRYHDYTQKIIILHM